MDNTTIINIFNNDNSNIAYINTQFYCNTAFIIFNLQKDFPKDNLPFVCLKFYKHNCLNILASNICFRTQGKNQ